GEGRPMTVSMIDLRPVEPSAASVPPPPPAPVSAPVAASAPISASASAPLPPLQPLVARVRRRLGRIAGRELLLRKAAWAIGAGALLGASRPLLWPLGDAAPLWLGFARALGLTALGSAVTAFGFLLAGRYTAKTTELGAARAIDHAKGLAE